MKTDDDEKQIKTDDDFFRMSEEQWKPKKNYDDDNLAAKIKNLFPLLVPIAFILIIIIGAATVFLQMQTSSMNENLIYLNKIVANIDTAGLKSEIAAMGVKIEGIKKENDKLKSDLAHLRNELDTVKTRKEKADKPVQKKPVVRKRPVNKNSRVR